MLLNSGLCRNVEEARRNEEPYNRGHEDIVEKNAREQYGFKTGILVFWHQQLRDRLLWSLERNRKELG